MTAKSLGEKLQRLTNQSQKRINTSEGAKREKECKKLERRAKSIARDLIKQFPSRLKKAARNGRDSEQLLDSTCMEDGLFEKVVHFIVEYCQKNGLYYKIERYRPSDDSPLYDYLLVYWKEPPKTYNF